MRRLCTSVCRGRRECANRSLLDDGRIARRRPGSRRSRPTSTPREADAAAAPKLVVGDLTHGVRSDEPVEYVGYLRSLKTLETTFDTGGGFCVSLKKASR